MKKYVILLLFVLLFSCTLVTEASVGDVEIVVEESEIEFVYTKIADYVDGKFVWIEPYADCEFDLNDIGNNVEMRNIIDKISTYEMNDKRKVKTKNQIANIDNLEEGVYLIESVSGQKYQMMPMIITIPSGTTGELSYHLSVFPKIQENVEGVETRDTTPIICLIILCIISLLIVLSLSCVFFRTVLQ